MSDDKATAIRPAFKDLIVKEYTFNVETPDGQLFQFEFCAPTQSEIWVSELAMPPKPEPPLKNFSGMVATGDLKPNLDHNDPGYKRAMLEWSSEFMARKILLCWKVEIPGKTDAEKLAHLQELPNWTFAALSRCAQLVTAAGQVALVDQPFRAEPD